MRRFFIAVAMLAASLIWAGSGQAATQTANMPVTTTVLGTCSMTVLPSINFGNYTGAAINVTSSIGVTCNSGTPYTIYMGAGDWFVSGWRKVGNGIGNSLSYGVWDAVSSLEWSDVGYTNTYPFGAGVTGVGTGVNVNHNMNATLFGGFVVPTGVYTDNVLVTVVY